MPKVTLPLKEQILEAMKVAETSEEAADYLVQQFKKIVTAAKVKDGAQDMIQRLEQYRNLVKMKLGKIGEPWSGEPAWISNFQNMQANLAKAAADVLVSQGVSKNVHLDIAISESSKWLRAYSENEENLDAKQVAEFDILFNAWLASNNIVSKDGAFYEVDIEGKIRENQQGKIKVDPEIIKALIGDENSGYIPFLEKKGIPPISIQQHILPAAEVKPAKAAPVAAKPEVTPAPAAKAAEPQEPQAPGAGAKR